MKYWLQYWCFSCADWRDLYDPGGALVARATLPQIVDEARRRLALGWRIRILGNSGDVLLELQP